MFKMPVHSICFFPVHNKYGLLQPYMQGKDGHTRCAYTPVPLLGLTSASTWLVYMHVTELHVCKYIECSLANGLWLYIDTPSFTRVTFLLRCMDLEMGPDSDVLVLPLSFRIGTNLTSSSEFYSHRSRL